MTEVDPNNEATYHECVIPSDSNRICVPKQEILEELKRYGYGDEATFAVKLALEEALCNAVKHGNKSDPTKSVTVRYAVNKEKVVVVIRDEGAGFALEEVPDPTTSERLPIPSGRGIMLIRAYMDEVAYRDDGRELYFVKHRVSKKPSN